MIKRILALLLVSTALTVAHAATITFLPISQTINLGDSTTVNVSVSGLSVGQALGAFDLLVLNNSSIITPTSVFFFSNLGDPTMELTDFSLTSGSANAAETSFESTADLLSLQGGLPFSLFQLTYKAVGAGTSSLTFGSSPLILADGDGSILPTPTLIAGSITVRGDVIPPSPVPEPSTFVLLGTGGGALLSAFKRRSIRK
ncbi:hypothetical protein BH10ACI4_BH10ACI4_21530 [soil metagenome]